MCHPHLQAVVVALLQRLHDPTSPSMPCSYQPPLPPHTHPMQTTLVALLQRLYDPDEGRVLIDGVDLRDLDAAWYRAHIGVVSQVRLGNGRWCIWYWTSLFFLKPGLWLA